MQDGCDVDGSIERLLNCSALTNRGEEEKNGGSSIEVYPQAIGASNVAPCLTVFLSATTTIAHQQNKTSFPRSVLDAQKYSGPSRHSEAYQNLRRLGFPLLKSLNGSCHNQNRAREVDASVVPHDVRLKCIDSV